MNLAVVVIAYNRPKSLLNLLNSLARAEYDNEFSLTVIISIDKSEDDSVLKVAQNFAWNYGPKIIIPHEVNLGLKKHVLSCGDLTNSFDAVILLEDDLIVSPYFFEYTKAAIKNFGQEDKIAGIALFEQRYNEIANCLFEPINDGFDNYFMQVPCSWGQIFSKKQWSQFRLFYSGFNSDFSQSKLPDFVLNWPSESSWKKYFYEYMVQNDLFFVYPRIGLSTNTGEIGTHFTERTGRFQASLLLGSKIFNFSRLESSLSIYDAYQELSGLVYSCYLKDERDVDFDINGTKMLSSINSQYLISSKRCLKPLSCFSMDFYPYENNVLFQNGAQELLCNVIHFGLKKDFIEVNPMFNRVDYDVKRLFGADYMAEYDWMNTMEFKFFTLFILPLAKLRKRIFANKLSIKR